MILVKKKLGPKTFVSKKNLCPKQICVQKNFVFKNFLVPKIVVRKMLGAKTFFGPTKFLSKNIEFTQILGQENLSGKNFWVQNISGLTCLIT